ncbi:MAG: hypothetical protein JWP43_3543 [Ramlibacter sp.]|nr:hypothetical protein [Ramlibacter sp.]
MNSAFAGRKQIESALLDYHRAPGQYPLQLRRPEILFSSLKKVLQLASGRLPDGQMPPSLAVQRAAGFFVSTALLHPAADHYTLLGLAPSANAAAIKERYRQMMRLMHPDFASSAGGAHWPPDAASRINQAYEVLARDAQRRTYDEQLVRPSAPAPLMGTLSAARLKAAAGRAPRPDPRRVLRRVAGAFGGLAAAALLAAFLVRGHDAESLVQRATAPALPKIATALESGLASVTAMPPVAERIALAESVPPAAMPSPNLEAPQIVSPRPAEPPATIAPLAAASMSLRTSAALAERAPDRPPPAPRAAPVFAQAPALSSAPASPPSRREAVPNVTMAEAHALLSVLLQQLESGSAERVLSGLERSARNSPTAQALARQYGDLVDGARSIKVANVQLHGEPREERLLVKGQVLLEIGESAQMHTGELALEAEFAKRNGAVVMTRLGRAQASGAAAQ